MTCSDVERVLPEIIEGGEHAQFEAHLKSCAACSELVSDLQQIASEARDLAASDEPPPRLWIKIAAELRAEGIIREPEAVPARPVLVSRKRRWSAWWLAPVAAVLVVAGSYFSINHSSVGPQVAVQNPPTVTSPPEPGQNQSDVRTTPPPQVAPQPAARQAAKSATPVDGENAPLVTVGTDDGQLLRRIGSRAPDMRATFESQLNAVNAYITDAEAYLRQNPDDEATRQQLMEAYDQKAMLYQMALDHVQ